MPQAFGVVPLGVGAHVKNFAPRLIVQLRGLVRPRQVCLTAVGEFDFRSFTAVGADNEQHRGSRSVRHGGGRGLVDQASVPETLDGERRVDRMRFVPANCPPNNMLPTPPCFYPPSSP